MYRKKNKRWLQFHLTCYISFTTEFNVTKLYILSMVKHLKYKKDTESITNVQFASDLRSVSPKVLSWR